MPEQSSESALMKQNFAPKIFGYFPIGTYYAHLENLCKQVDSAGDSLMIQLCFSFSSSDTKFNGSSKYRQV